MTNALVLDVPMELGLELMPIVRPHLPNAEGEALEGIIDEGDGIGLGVSAVDLESTDTGGIIDSGILAAFDCFAIFTSEDQELDVDLNLVAGSLLLVAGSVNLAKPRPSRESVQAIALQDTRRVILSSCFGSLGRS